MYNVKKEICIDIKSVRELIHSINTYINTYSESLLCKSKWGYSKFEYNPKEFRKLSLYKNTLENYIEYLNEGVEPCLKDSEVEQLKDNILSIVPLCKESTYCISDRTNFDSWVLQNPYCVAYEAWERCLYTQMPEFTVKVNKDTCKILFDIFATDKKEDIFRIKYLVDAHKIRCDLGFDPSLIDLNTCKFEYQALAEKYDCDLDFDTYFELKKCNLTFGAISTLIRLGISPIPDPRNQTCLVKFEGVLYDICKLVPQQLGDIITNQKIN